MRTYSFHLVQTQPLVTAKALLRAPSATGLLHAECLAVMQLGAPTISPARLQLSRLAMFAQWQDDVSMDAFLREHPLGKVLNTGWYIRLEFLRQWGSLAALPDLVPAAARSTPDEPVVAVTLARLKLPQLPRFLTWGKPVERLVRDDPSTTLALAAIRPPRTICTFSIWRTQRAMLEMVNGHGDVPDPRRHAAAMAERARKDFHREFTTLRFRPLSEYGSWQGGDRFVP